MATITDVLSSGELPNFQYLGDLPKGKTGKCAMCGSPKASMVWKVGVLVATGHPVTMVTCDQVCAIQVSFELKKAMEG